MTEPPQETCFVSNNCAAIEGMKRFSHEAMATTFELLIVHKEERYVAQAAVAAFDEVDRLERELSRFIENSDVARINNLPANQSLQLGLDTFECLKIAKRVNAETNGAFDITIGNLLRCWRNEDGSPRNPQWDTPHSGIPHVVSQRGVPPSLKEIDIARMRTGMNLLQLNETEHTITLSASPMHVDLGGIGKGYAVDRVAELLREWSIDVALISGGYSSVLALDAPPGEKGWPLTMTNPAGDKKILARLFLKNSALSGSGVQKGHHIIDPRTAQAVKGRRAAWSSAPDAATADALSTAFMIMGLDEIKKYCTRHPDALAMIILEDGTPRWDTTWGIPLWGVSHCGEGEKQSQQKPCTRRGTGKILRFGPWERIVN